MTNVAEGKVAESSVEWLTRVLEAAREPGWVLREEGFVPPLEHEVESRLAIGNGFLGLRAALEVPSPASHPRTFVAGLFDLAGEHYRVPALIPVPDWSALRLTVAGRPFSIEDGKTLLFVRELDLARGVLLTHWWQRTSAGHDVRLRSLRLVSLAARALGLQFVRIEVGRPVTLDLETCPATEAEHLSPVLLTRGLSEWVTAGQRRPVAVASSAVLRLGERNLPTERAAQGRWRWRWDADPERPADFVRAVAIAHGGEHGPLDGAAYGGVDGSEQSAAARAQRTVRRVRGSGERALYEAHAGAWQRRWADADVVVEPVDPADESQRALRFAVFHLTAAANPESPRTSVGARGLTGEGYLGHVFWDTEIFLLPFYTLTWPAAARAMLRYRFHTLPAARAKAAALGYRGALYAWESAETGEETTPAFALGPAGEVIPIRNGAMEHHISADVAYAVWQYWHATHDHGFLLEAGAEILLETARFWASRAALERDGRCHIRSVIGPDEYHEDVDDNAFTNHMARWNIERGLEAAELLRRRWPERWQALRHDLALTDEELAEWRRVAERMYSAFDEESGLFEQFQGFFGLERVDLAQFATRTVPMDVVLGSERTRRSQVIKQADVLMLLALLGDAYPRAVREANFDFYEPRCGHGSSLSPPIHALVAARLGRTELARHYFDRTSAIDLDNTMGNSAAGVHIGALGGLWQAAVLGFGGVRTAGEVLGFDPHLPASWRALAFPLQWRGRRLRVAIRRDTSTFTASLERGRPLAIELGEVRHRLVPGETWTASLRTAG